MTSQTQMLPFFVYGTLRPLEGNHGWAVASYERFEHDGVTLKGFDMFLGRGFPYIVDGDEDSKVIGTLIEFSPEDFEQALEGLDALEGYHEDPTYKYNNHYDRRIVKIEIDGEMVEAYTYVASNANAGRIRRTLTKSKSGNWYNHRSEAVHVTDASRYVTFREQYERQSN